jgi:hypothetical protein
LERGSGAGWSVDGGGGTLRCAPAPGGAVMKPTRAYILEHDLTNSYNMPISNESRNATIGSRNMRVGKVLGDRRIVVVAVVAIRVVLIF